MYWGYIGIMEKNMETTIMENQMEMKWKMKWKLGNIWHVTVGVSVIGKAGILGY